MYVAGAFLFARSERGDGPGSTIKGSHERIRKERDHEIGVYHSGCRYSLS